MPAKSGLIGLLTASLITSIARNEREQDKEGAGRGCATLSCSPIVRGMVATLCRRGFEKPGDSVSVCSFSEITVRHHLTSIFGKLDCFPNTPRAHPLSAHTATKLVQPCQVSYFSPHGSGFENLRG
jgi:hypothetical protein